LKQTLLAALPVERLATMPQQGAAALELKWLDDYIALIETHIWTDCRAGR